MFSTFTLNSLYSYGLMFQPEELLTNEDQPYNLLPPPSK